MRVITITLTGKQAMLLTTYIIISNNYRKGEIKACSELGQEKTADGKLRFPNLASDAEWWIHMHYELERIRRIIDKAPYVVEKTANKEAN